MCEFVSENAFEFNHTHARQQPSRDDQGVGLLQRIDRCIGNFVIQDGDLGHRHSHRRAQPTEHDLDARQRTFFNHDRAEIVLQCGRSDRFEEEKENRCGDHAKCHGSWEGDPKRDEDHNETDHRSKDCTGQDRPAKVLGAFAIKWRLSTSRLSVNRDSRNGLLVLSRGSLLRARAILV